MVEFVSGESCKDAYIIGYSMNDAMLSLKPNWLSLMKKKFESLSILRH